MSDLRFFNLPIPAPRRLAMMKATGRDWRKVRAYRLDSYDRCFGLASAGMNGKRTVLYSFDAESMPVRDIRFADECVRLNHNGWYADYEGNGDRGVIRGIIARLPHGLFLSGYHWSDNDEYVIFTDQSYSEEEAARCADVEASHYAETCRDDDARFRALTDAESLCESRESDIRDEWENYRAAWSDRHTSVYALTAAIKARTRVRELIEELRADRRELESAREAYERG